MAPKSDPKWRGKRPIQPIIASGMSQQPFWITLLQWTIWGAHTNFLFLMGKEHTALNMIFSATYYLELQNAIYLFTSDEMFDQVRLSMFYNVKTTNLTFYW